MRVYLADLCYLNDWDTNQPVPLNVGYIAAYLKARRPGDDIQIFKDPRHLVRQLAAAPPDVLGMSHYDWNSNLNLQSSFCMAGCGSSRLRGVRFAL